MPELVSVLIPAYNLEGFVENCLDSLIAQTYQNWEGIIVNDGSRDKTAEIVSSYSEKDKRIILVNQENAGVSAARNNALDHAKGKYVVFVDGDDFLHPQALEMYVSVAERSDADIAAFNYLSVTDVPKEYKQYTNEPEYNMLTYPEFTNIGGNTLIAKTVWGKIYKREYIGSARFPLNVRLSEDQMFNIRLLIKPAKIAFSDIPLYCYLQREASATSKKFDIRKFPLNAMNEWCQDMKVGGNAFLFGYAMQTLYLAIFNARLSSVNSDCKKETYKLCRKLGKKWILFWICNSGIDLKTRVAFTAFFFSQKLYELARIRLDPSMKEYLHRVRK